MNRKGSAGALPLIDDMAKSPFPCFSTLFYADPTLLLRRHTIWLSDWSLTEPVVVQHVEGTIGERSANTPGNQRARDAHAANRARQGHCRLAG